VLCALLNNEGEVEAAATCWLQHAGSDALHVLRPPHDRHATFYSSFCAGTGIEASCLRAAVEAVARGADEDFSPAQAAELLARVISPVNHDGIRDTMLRKLDMHDSSLALIDAPVYIDEIGAYNDSVTVADDCVQTLRRLYVPTLTASRLTAACMLVAIPLGTEVHSQSAGDRRRSNSP